MHCQWYHMLGLSALKMLWLIRTATGKGAKLFGKCNACHTFAAGRKNKFDGNLWDIIGRAKACARDFSYSPALKDKGGNWGCTELEAFLANPKGFKPGTKMAFAGLEKPNQRADISVYLRSMTDAPKTLS